MRLICWAAIKPSESLVVMCLHAAAAWPCSIEEIRPFKHLPRQKRVRALIVDGERVADDPAQGFFQRPWVTGRATVLTLAIAAIAWQALYQWELAG